MSNVNAYIQNSFNTFLSEIDGIPPIAWPNVKYDPVKGTSYVKSKLIKGQAKMIDTDSKQEYTGIFQVSVFVPMNKGTKILTDLLDLVTDSFRAVNTITDGLYRRTVCTGPTLQDDDGWYEGIIEVYYLIYD